MLRSILSLRLYSFRQLFVAFTELVNTELIRMQSFKNLQQKNLYEKNISA